MSRPLSSLSLALALVLGACGTNTGFPSLAPRPIEKATVDEPTVAPPPQAIAAIDADLSRRLADIVERGESADRAFQAELARARAAIERASGAAAGSEPWVAGQQSLSAIEALRSGVLGALADLDSLRRERAESAGQAELDAFGAAAARLGVIEAEESRIMSELAARIG